jgi:formyl-CoA transferase
MNSALQGVKVLDLSQVVSGPSCTQVLGDFGADILKVERPDSGDIARSTRPHLDGLGFNFLAYNRNKRSLAIDLQQEEGKAIVRRLADQCDVLVENFRPGVLSRLGLGYDDLSKTNPRLIYASISGYGQTGPYRDRKGQDLLAQAIGGLMWRNGAREDPPTLVGFPIADLMAGANLCQGILIALYARERTGRGQRVETSLLDSVLSPQMQDFMIYLNTGEAPARPPRGGTRPHHGPTSGVFKAKDGYFVVTLVFERGNQVSRMCELLSLPDLGQEGKFSTAEGARANDPELRALFANEFAKKNVDEWVALFEAQGIMCAPVQSYERVATDPQVLHNQMRTTFKHPSGRQIESFANPLSLSETPWSVRRDPPGLGAQTDDILSEFGLDADQIAALRSRKIIS